MFALLFYVFSAHAHHLKSKHRNTYTLTTLLQTAYFDTNVRQFFMGSFQNMITPMEEFQVDVAFNSDAILSRFDELHTNTARITDLTTLMDRAIKKPEVKGVSPALLFDIFDCTVIEMLERLSHSPTYDRQKAIMYYETAWTATCRLAMSKETANNAAGLEDTKNRSRLKIAEEREKVAYEEYYNYMEPFARFANGAALAEEHVRQKDVRMKWLRQVRFVVICDKRL